MLSLAAMVIGVLVVGWLLSMLSAKLGSDVETVDDVDTSGDNTARVASHPSPPAAPSALRRRRHGR
jgi:hypothetical protein